MINFIPDGYISLTTAVERCASIWRKSEWESLVADECRDTQLDRKKFEIKKRIKSGAVLSESEKKVLKPNDNKTLNKNRRGKLLEEIWLRLRQELYNGHLPFFVQSDSFGTLLGSGTAIWGSQKAVIPPEKICTDCWIDERRIGFVSGRTLLFEDDLSLHLDGKLVQKRIAWSLHPELPPEAESVTKQKGAAGGRPPKFDALKFQLEAFALIEEGAVIFKNQTDLRQKALEKYAATLPAGSDGPSDDWAKPIIRDLWHRLNLGRE
ncbi:hypothetical protein U0C82_18595 [Fulvimarina sp. 2208YS6-2-32]|uniref:Uncharacterized protein n=1 Tax=Fulvimarina uroteuthidis TaxID=3098149 RepID=A0ABU5I6X5_9HYPH|nr:hypothetical protein [Fulvimarina sp. 2208YS6-2-32]MDY8111134.1 hypothetical protein [Fulvimarina sp. 2208YS6-2-32]